MANNSIRHFQALSETKGLKLVHLNARSVLPKIDQLRLTLEDSRIDIITMSETWLHPQIDPAMVRIEGYSLFRQDRTRKHAKGLKKGGGLIVYVKNSLAPGVRTLDSLSVNSAHLESQWLEISREHARNIIVCNVYRPPDGKIDQAFKALNNSLEQISVRKKDLFIMGDLNINYNNKKSTSYRQLAFFERVNNLAQLIKNSTRINQQTSTILDLILTNAQYISHAGTLDTYISDHQPIFVVKKKKRNPKLKVSFLGRQYKNYNPITFANNLKTQDWQNLYDQDSVNCQWSIMYDRIVAEADKQCPIKEFEFNYHKPPYLTNALLDQIRNRDYFYKKAKKFGDEDDWNIAKYLRNQTNKNIRGAKASYIKDQLDACKNDSSKFWRQIKAVYPNKSIRDKHEIKLKVGNDLITQDRVAEYINEFFINVGSPPVNTTPVIPAPDLNLNQNPANNNPENEDLKIEKANSVQIYNLTKTLNPRKSSGLPNINPTLMKDSLLALNDQLTHILNSSITSSKFPSEWKNAKVIPIPKSGDLMNVSNYRPISLLPTPGKLLEKIIHTQLEEHLENESLLTHFQYGFRKNRSTTHAVTQLLNHVNLNLNKSIPTVALFIDFRKAFDCLQHPTLLAKLQTLNLSPETVGWLQDYLTDRHQSTYANGTMSPMGAIKQGVPQGSILGPLLYIIYANDITSTILKSKVAFYADDTVIYTSSKNVNLAIKGIQSDLNRLTKWCRSNGVHINPDKTKYMIFSNRQLNSPHKNLKVNSTIIERVPTFSYLGVVLDQHLTFDNHAKYTIDRVSAKVYQLKKIRKLLTKKAALLIYKNMILPIMEYGDIYMTSATQDNRKKLQKLQNKALKCALEKDKRFNTNLLHDEAKIHKLKHRRKTHLLQHMYQISTTPEFQGWKVRVRVTRNSNKKLMKTKKPNTTKFLNSITYRGPKLWNKLPREIQESDNYYTFKLKTQSHILPKQYHGD